MTRQQPPYPQTIHVDAEVFAALQALMPADRKKTRRSTPNLVLRELLELPPPGDADLSDERP